MTTPSDIFVFPVQDFVGDGPEFHDEVVAWLNAKPDFPGGYFANTSTWSPEMVAWFSAVHSDIRYTDDPPIYEEVALELRYLSTLTEEEWGGVRADLARNPDWSGPEYHYDPTNVSSALGKYADVEPVEIHTEDDDLGHLLNPFAD